MSEYPQFRVWKGNFGADYTDRNVKTPAQEDEIYQKFYGVTRSAMNQEFLGDFDRSLKTLEVGTNIGNQLMLLKKMGFTNVYGIDAQFHAIKLSKNRLGYALPFVQASALHLPFHNQTFDLVFTSTVLIHVAPENLKEVFQEMYRCTRQYIWGFEFYHPVCTAKAYHDHDNLLWGGDYSGEFLKHFPDLKLLKQQRYDFHEPGKSNVMYLLEKS